MVQVSQKNNKVLQGRLLLRLGRILARICKPETCIAVLIGMAVLALFATEQLSQQAIVSRSTPSKGHTSSTSSGQIGMATRYGLFPRQPLRTDNLHEIDPLLQGEEDSRLRSMTPQQTTKVVTAFPRVVFLEDLLQDSSFPSSTPTNKTTAHGQRRRHVEKLGNTCCKREPDYYRYEFEKPFYETCKPTTISKANVQVHPTCNILHEMALDDFSSDISLLSVKGSWRSTWKMEHPRAVLKLLSFKRRFDHRSAYAHAVDIMAMEQLTASPYVINAYGFCGQSVITEWAPTSGRDYMKQETIRTMERLKMARDLARGLADIQAFRPLIEYKDNSLPTNTAVFAHNDINIANTVQIDGKVKWNDFNIGVLLRQNNGSDCGVPARYKGGLWRSPEEIRNTSYVQLQRSDVYSLGNILYQVMTRHQPWSSKELEPLSLGDIVKLKKQGKLPTIPEQYRNSTRTAVHAMLFATVSCYQPNPLKRLTAFELAKSLGTVYDWLKEKKKTSPKKVRDLFMK
jgi:hypothetical protein